MTHCALTLSNISFTEEALASCTLAVGRRQNISVGPGSAYVSLLNNVKNSRLS